MRTGSPQRSQDSIAPETNLPLPLNTLVGRTSELKGIGDAVRATRLVTITGPAGVGKTRLAIELAGRYASRGAQGVWLVDLTAAAKPDEVAAEAARALHVRPGKGSTPTEALGRYLAERETLIVLDNCEHVLDQCSDLVAKLLSAAAGVRILATSREFLGVSGETVWRLDPLAPDHARRLFVERARQRRPDFLPDPPTDETIARLCERLDRLPLAIELAAARVSMMTPAEVFGALENRIEVLARAERDAPAHHRTVRAALDWSYDLLDEDEQAALRALAVFAGSFDADAAMAVAPSLSFDLLGRLVDKSLVSVVAPEAGRTRYRLLETVREYALERLEDEAADAARERHLRHFAAHAEISLAEWLDTGKQHYVNRLADDYDNVRMALDRALQTDPCTGIRIFCGLRDLFLRSGEAEGGRVIGLLLDRCPARDRDRSLALIAAGQMAISMADFDAAHERLDEARALLEALDEPGLDAWLDFFTGLALTFSGSVEGRVHLQRSRDSHRELGNATGEVRALNVLGFSHMAQAEFEAAKPLCEEALEIAAAADDRFGEGQANLGLGTIALLGADGRESASTHFRRVVELLVPLRESILLPAALVGQADVLSRSDPARALRVAAAGSGLRSRGGGEFNPFYRARLEAIREAGATALGEEAERVWSEGARLGIDEAVALAFGEKRARPAGADGLSRRELEVAEMVSDGLANKEIAARLHLSVRTVESHVRHALTKLALDNRTQLATWARERVR